MSGKVGGGGSFDPEKSPLFSGAPADRVRQVLEAGRRRRYARNEVVFHEGDVAASLHVILAGRFAVRVSTHVGEDATLVVLPPGEVFGEMALLGGDDLRTATVVALEAGETLAVDAREFHALRHVHPEVTEVLLSLLRHKVERYTAQLLEALYVPAETRILRRVLELADLYGPGDPTVTVPLRQEDLAGLAGTSRATVNKVLREEEKRGVIRLSRSATTIVDRAKLARRAGAN